MVVLGGLYRKLLGLKQRLQHPRYCFIPIKTCHCILRARVRSLIRQALEDGVIKCSWMRMCHRRQQTLCDKGSGQIDCCQVRRLDNVRPACITRRGGRLPARILIFESRKLVPRLLTLSSGISEVIEDLDSTTSRICAEPMLNFSVDVVNCKDLA